MVVFRLYIKSKGAEKKCMNDKKIVHSKVVTEATKAALNDVG